MYYIARNELCHVVSHSERHPKLKPCHQEVWIAIHSYFRQHGRYPTIREISKQIGKSPTAIQNSRKLLAKQGYIRIEPGKPGLVLIKLPSKLECSTSMPSYRDIGISKDLVFPSTSRWLPVMGEIAAGPMFEPFIDTGEVLPVDYEGRQARDFALRISGDSMIGDCIRNGSFVVMRPTPEGYEPRDGEIVAIWVEAQGTTLKHFHQTEGVVTLKASNPKYSPITIDINEQNVRVQAKCLLTLQKLQFQ